MKVHILDDWFDTLRGLPCFEMLAGHDVTVWTGVYPHVDVPACTANGVLLCSNMHAGSPSYAAAELTLGLMLASFRQIPEQAASLRAGNWMMGVGRTLRGRTLGLYGYGRIAGAVADYAKALGMDVQWWSSEAGRARARADGARVAESRNAFFATSDVFDQEPLRDPTHPLLTHPNVLPTPHIGYVTEDEFDLQFTDIFEQVNAFAAGEPVHMINPEVWRA